MVQRFANLQQLQNYLTRADIVSTVFKNDNVKRVLAETMSQAVKDVVYDSYAPKQYNRRGDQGGLSDVRNMNFTTVNIVGNTISILFENLTLGQTQQIVYDRSSDSLVGQFITDTIVDNRSDNWIQQGEWSRSRDFISETVDRIKANPTPLINAIKASYRKLGFQVR